MRAIFIFYTYLSCTIEVRNVSILVRDITFSIFQNILINYLNLKKLPTQQNMESQESSIVII